MNLGGEGYMKRLMRLGLMAMGLAALVTYVDHQDYTQRIVSGTMEGPTQNHRIEEQLTSIEEYLQNHPEKGEQYKEDMAHVGYGIMREAPQKYEEKILGLNEAYVREGGLSAALKGYQRLPPQMQRELLYQGTKEQIRDTTSSAYHTLREYLDDLAK